MATAQSADLASHNPSPRDDAGVPTPPTRPQGVGQRQSGSAMQQWHDWFTDPDNKAFLAQMGTSLLASSGSGDLMGNLGRAAGEGFEAKDRAAADFNARQQQQFENDQKIAAQALAEREATSQEGLRSAEAGYYSGLSSSREEIAKLRAGGAQGIGQLVTYQNNQQKHLDDLILNGTDPSDPDYIATQQDIDYARNLIRQMRGGAAGGGGGGGVDLSGMSAAQVIQMAKDRIARVPASRQQVIDLIRSQRKDVDISGL